MFHTGWSARKRRGSGAQLARSRKARPLRLEPLEDRLLLAVRTWNGAGPDNNWNTSGNWVGNVVPVANDELVFPAGAARLANVNNLPAGTGFTSITLSGGGYSITGNAVELGVNGITNNVTGTANSLNLDLTLAAARTLTVTGTGPLTLGGVLSGAGGITKAGDGTLQLAGAAPNAFAGTTTVNAGILELNKAAGTLAVPGALTVGDGTGTDLVRLLANGQLVATAIPAINSGGQLELGAFAQTLAGLSLTGGGVAATTGTLTLTGNVTTSAAANAATISGTLALGGADRTFTVADGAAADDLMVSAVISGSGALIKSGPGRLVFAGANAYTGTTTVQAGTLTLRNAASLGATSAGSTVASQAVLELQGGIAVGAEALTFQALAGGPAGTLRNVADNNSWAGAVTLTAETAVMDTAAGQLTISGVLGGGAATNALTKRGAGTLVLSGTAANTFAGTTTVAGGVLQLNKAAGVNAVAGNLVVGDGTGDANSDVLRLAAANQIPDAALLTIATSGRLDLNGFIEMIGPLTMTGGSVTTGDGILILGGNVTTNAAAAAAQISGNLRLGGGTRTFTVADGAAADDLVLAAVVSDGAAEAGLIKAGPGTLVLSANNTYTGTTTVNAGTLLVNGQQAGSAVTVAAEGRLGGSGTVGAVTNAGTLAPGTVTGILRAGNVTFSMGATFRVELNGTTAGTGYDQLNVTGTVNLGGATLNASLGFASVGGNQFTVLANDGSDVVTGTFNGLAEGASLTINNRPFRISYRGGDGNDVVLTDASVATTTTLTTSSATTVFGQSVTFTAVVAAVGDPGTPAGTVTFRDGTTVLGTATLANGRATFTVPTPAALPLAVGTHSITATYEGNDTFSPSTSAALTQTVNKAATTITVTATPNPATVGREVVLTATVAIVAPGVAAPTGTVTFRDGTTVLGTVNVAPSGLATFTTSSLALGARTITASYSGDALLEASTSSALALQVNPALPTNQRWLAQLYQDVLRRAVDGNGLASWSSHLDQGMTRQQVVLAITASQEYRELVVRDLYRTYLRREAEPGGLNAFVGFLRGGGTVERAAAAIIGSPEYFTNNGGTNDAWLTAVYRGVLNRAVDPPGRSAHLAGLAAGFTRQRIAAVILTSDENRRLVVQSFYQTYLRRGPDPNGLNAHVAALNQGARQEQVIAVIAGSAEYFARV